MSQILFRTDFVNYLKTTDKTHFSVDDALILFQQYVMNYNNCRINGIYYWLIPKDIRMASNLLEILNTIKLNLINQAGYTEFRNFDVSIKVLKSKHFAFVKNIDHPSVCDFAECEYILIHL